jgi:hypothetical protein
MRNPAFLYLAIPNSEFRIPNSELRLTLVQFAFRSGQHRIGR